MICDILQLANICKLKQINRPKYQCRVRQNMWAAGHWGITIDCWKVMIVYYGSYFPVTILIKSWFGACVKMALGMCWHSGSGEDAEQEGRTQEARMWLRGQWIKIHRPPLISRSYILSCVKCRTVAQCWGQSPARGGFRECLLKDNGAIGFG